MARVLTVVNERVKVQKEYREYLENKYVSEQREIYLKKIEETKKEPFVPELSD
jgi:hypothetical protein